MLLCVCEFAVVGLFRIMLCMVDLPYCVCGCRFGWFWLSWAIGSCMFLVSFDCGCFGCFVCVASFAR